MRRAVRMAACLLCGLGTLVCLAAPPHPKVESSLNQAAERGAPAARPVIWPAGPLEVRVAFPGAPGAELANGLVGRKISFGDTEKPGTPVLASNRGVLRIAAVAVIDDGRTLRIATDPHPREATYVLTIPGPAASLDLAYDLTGAEVTWEEGGDAAAPTWSGWWPSVDTKDARALTTGSVEHDRLFTQLSRPGRLSLRTFVALPNGKVTVRLEADGPFEATLANEDPRVVEAAGGRRQAIWEQESTGDAVELTVTVPTGVEGRTPTLQVVYRTQADQTFRPLPRSMQSLSWAPPPISSAGPPPPLPFDLDAGDRTRGEAVFFSDEAKCSACHKRGGRGGDVGPDLSDLAGRDPAEIYREIADPSAVIRPDYLPYTVALKDGQIAVGVVRAEGADAIRVLDTDGKALSIKRSQIEELRPSGTSIMPVGLVGALGEARMRDLLAYVLSPVAAAAKPGPGH